MSSNTSTKRKKIFNISKGKCHYCKTQISLDSSSSIRMELEHVIPKSQGGTDRYSNLVASCVYCNKSKHNRTPDQWKNHLRSRILDYKIKIKKDEALLEKLDKVDL